MMKDLALVHKIANGYYRHKLSYEDIVQEGLVGLLKARNHYNGPCKFSAYAWYHIKYAIRQYIVKYANIVQTNTHKDLQLPVNTIRFIDNMPGTDNVVENVHKLQQLEKLRKLPLKTQEMIALKLLKGLTYAEIGAKFKISGSAVEQTIKRGVYAIHKATR